MRNEFIKGILIGFLFGILFISCESNIFADDSGGGGVPGGSSSYGEIGTVEWNPLYFKIVE